MIFEYPQRQLGDRSDFTYKPNSLLFLKYPQRELGDSFRSGLASGVFKTLRPHIPSEPITISPLQIHPGSHLGKFPDL